jgi:circadian clock protein KaiC
MRPTGIPKFDLILGGGLRPGTVLVVAGAPGTGKSVLSLQLAFAAGTEERRAFYYGSLSESSTKLRAHMAGFEFFDADALDRRVSLLSVEGVADSGVAPFVAVVDELIRVAYAESPAMIVVDSVRALGHGDDPVAHRRLLYRLASHIGHSDTILVLVGEYPDLEPRQAPEFAVADGIIEMANEPEGPVDRRWLRVRKMRGAASLGGQHTFRIDDAGIRMLPRLEAVAPRSLPPRDGTRCSIGVEMLDRMTEGGLPVGSSSVLMGPSGVGKTVLGLGFCAAGAARGEHTLFLSFEESEPELRAKAEVLGLDLGGAATRVLHVTPPELELDALGVLVLEQVEEHRPQRVVLDGLALAIPRARTAGRFPSYLWALNAAIHGTDTTSLVTYEIAAMGGMGQLDSISHLFHNVLIARYMERQAELGRVLNVMKMRGSRHHTGLLPFEIGTGGIRPTGEPGAVANTLGWTVLGSAIGARD